MQRAKQIFPRVSFGTRAIGSSVLAYSILNILPSPYNKTVYFKRKSP
jgi:hypothetical protein